MNVNIYNTTDYENKRDWTIGENKPNSNPIKPNSQKAKMNANVYVIEDYDNEPPSGPKKQTQNKANLRKAKINKKNLKKQKFLS